MSVASILNEENRSVDNDLSWVEYFALKFDTKVVAVSPHYTSQNCSNCGHTVKKGLSTRTYKCFRCGTILQRDVNAAINILSKAKSTEGDSESNAWGEASSTCVGRMICKSKKLR